MSRTTLKLSDEQLVWLSKLSEPWIGASFSKQVAAKIKFSDGTVLELTSEGVDLAPYFECFRFHVGLDQSEVNGEPPLAFVNGAMKISLLQSEEWLDTKDSVQKNAGLLGSFVGSHCIGMPGTAPSNIELSCVVDSGVLLVAPTGERLIIRCDAMPCNLAITDKDDEIERDLGNYRVKELI